MGIIIEHFKDPYKPISIMECHKGLVHAAHLIFGACLNHVAVGKWTSLF